MIRDAPAESRMARVGRRLAKGTPELEGVYQYRLLASSIMNAVSLPGPRIYVTRGLYDRLKTDDILAAALAHEMAHLQARDSLKPRCRELGSALTKELSADQQGTGYLQAAGYRPEAMVELILLVKQTQATGWAARRAERLAQQQRRFEPPPR
ncbi:MAG: M48 family metallopeptidase [Phycisphaerae bacterium]